MGTEGFVPPSSVSEEETRRLIRAFMDRPDIPTVTGDRGFVEDVVRIDAVGMEWDIGLSVHRPEDPGRLARTPSGNKVGVFLLHGGSGDFKSMHPQAELLASKLGYKVVSMSFPGRHAFHTQSRDWPGRLVEANDRTEYSLEARTPIWKRGEHITPDQYELSKDRSLRPRYGTMTYAKAKPGTTFHRRMAGWPIAFEQGGIAVMQQHFPEEEYDIYVHGHSTGGPFANMLSQRVPNIRGILAIENSAFGYIGHQRQMWRGGLGKVEGYQPTEDEYQIPARSDSFNELYLRSWRDLARYRGSELLAREGPEALMRLPMVMEDILDEWEGGEPRAAFKAEWMITHDIEDSLREAAEVTADRLGLDENDTAALVERYLGLTRELQGPDVKPVPPVLFQLTAHSRDHSREVYEEVIIPAYQAMDPAPRTSLTQFGLGDHGYASGEYVDGAPYGIAPAAFEHWERAIQGGYFEADQPGSAES